MRPLLHETSKQLATPNLRAYNVGQLASTDRVVLKRSPESAQLPTKREFICAYVYPLQTLWLREHNRACLISAGSGGSYRHCQARQRGLLASNPRLYTIESVCLFGQRQVNALTPHFLLLSFSFTRVAS